MYGIKENYLGIKIIDVIYDFNKSVIAFPQQNCYKSIEQGIH